MNFQLAPHSPLTCELSAERLGTQLCDSLILTVLRLCHGLDAESQLVVLSSQHRVLCEQVGIVPFFSRPLGRNTFQKLRDIGKFTAFGTEYFVLTA